MTTIGATVREVIVDHLDLSHALAHCRETSTNHIVEVSILPVRVRMPIVGERWIVERAWGMWTFAGLITLGPTTEFGAAAPTGNDRHYAAGSQVLNTAPAPGGYAGWVCVTAGAPGEWKRFGLIEA